MQFARIGALVRAERIVRIYDDEIRATLLQASSSRTVASDPTSKPGQSACPPETRRLVGRHRVLPPGDREN